jgi:SAM-dependent methyltransferase
MPLPSEATYNRLAESFHLIFEDWNASMGPQAAVIDEVLRGLGVEKAARVLDCACGIGTQLLGLAALGYPMTGCDLAAASVRRAEREVSARGLEATLIAADMRDLSRVPGGEFSAVIAMDNSLPHLESDEDLLTAFSHIRAKLRTGGVLVASIRDYDRLVVERPTVQGPVFYRDAGRRRIVHQVWDWLDDRHYEFHLYITRETDAGWDTLHESGSYRAILREELTVLLGASDFVDVEWRFPEETGYYQPVVTARK